MTQQTIIKKPKSWKKVESSFFKFEKIGDTLEGLLKEKQLKTPDEQMSFYHLTTFDGKDTKFHGSNQLDDLLITISVPCYIKITLVNQLPSKFGNPLNIFEVSLGEN